MSGEQNPRRPLDGILDGLAESIAEEESAELLDEAAATTQNSKVVARDVKSTLEAALQKFEQRKLEAAREAYRRRAPIRSNKSDLIALTPDGRKRQLSTILQSNPEIGAALTAQHRNFETLSDEDVASTLEDLAELGLLDDLPGTSSED
jgi:hypothetical protein